MRRIFALLNGLAASFCLGMLLLSGSLEGSSSIRPAPQQRAPSCTSCSSSHAEPDAAQAEPSQEPCRLPLSEMRLLGGAIVIEQVFAIPGLGRLILGAIAERNYPLIQATILLVTCSFVFVNFAVDVVYALIDPRISE